MSTRKTVFADGEYYHVFNRGVDKRIIYADQYDMDRFFKSLVEFNVVDPIGSLYENSFLQLGGPTAKLSERLVNIIAYCLNPNHYHLILEQLVDGGISEFMKRLGGYAWYFNNKYERSGALFQGRFKAIHIDSNEYLLHLSAYVNLNNKVHRIKGESFRSSWNEYLNKNKTSLSKLNIILRQFSNSGEYKDFAESSLKDILGRKERRKEMEGLLLE